MGQFKVADDHLRDGALAAPGAAEEDEVEQLLHTVRWTSVQARPGLVCGGRIAKGPAVKSADGRAEEEWLDVD